jgi:hypothetical protein
MSFPKRDLVATVLVATAGVLYWLWAAGSAPSGLQGVRGVGVVILVLGFAASASAVVPGFEHLLHGNKTYLAVTAALGLVALAGGVQMLVTSSDVGLAVLMGAMGVLWLIATIHHALLAGVAGPRAGGTFAKTSAPPRVSPATHRDVSDHRTDQGGDRWPN